MFEMNTAETPELSIVVAFSSAAAQAENCLLSLSEPFQANVGTSYEILAVEATAEDGCGEARALACSKNVRYLRLNESGRWRARALKLGVENARAPWIGLLFGGAHILTSRVIEHALLARRLCSRPLVVVPEYCPGQKSRWHDEPVPKLQSGDTDYGALLDDVRFGPANPNGFLSPLLGAVCMFMPRSSFEAVSGVDERFDLPGGGALNFDFYSRLSGLLGTRLVVLGGEAALRQPQPEVSTLMREIEGSVEGLLKNRAEPLGPAFRPVHREPALLGPIPGPLQPFLSESFERLRFSLAMAQQRNEMAWYEDPRAPGESPR